MRKAMQAGTSPADSYAENSSVQSYSFQHFAKPLLRKAIHHLFSSVPPDASTAVIQCNGGHDAAGSVVGTTVPVHPCITVADFGCAYGQNTLQCMQFVVSTLIDSCAASGKMSAIAEIQYLFCDLPSNDFNALFQSLHKPIQGLTDQSERHSPKIFTAGVSGSFYGRVLPSASLHLGLCSYSLHWLSQIPPGVTDPTSPAWNGGSSWVHDEKSPKSVVDAYAGQSQADLTAFLKLRAEELVSGGVLFFMGPHVYHLPSARMGVTGKLLDIAWKELVAEGILKMEELDMFNLPLYMLTPQQIQSVVKDIPEFEVLHMEAKDTPLSKGVGNLAERQAHQILGMASSLLKPTLDDYLGKPDSEKLFQRIKIVAYRELDFFKEHFNHNIFLVALLRK